MEIRTGWNYALAIKRSREPADPVAHMRSLERASRLRARALKKSFVEFLHRQGRR